MKPATPNIQYIELDLKALGDKGMAELVTSLVESAPTSQLVLGNPALQTCVAVISNAGQAVKNAADAIVADETKLAADRQAHIDATANLATALVQYKGL